MLLVDATGGKDQRFRNIDIALSGLLYGGETSISINRTVGNGVVSYTESKLKLISEQAQYPFPVTRISLGYRGNQDKDVVVNQVRQFTGVIVLDEAEYMDKIEGLEEALKTLESAYIKIVYVRLVEQSIIDLMNEILDL